MLRLNSPWSRTECASGSMTLSPAPAMIATGIASSACRLLFDLAWVTMNAASSALARSCNGRTIISRDSVGRKFDGTSLGENIAWGARVVGYRGDRDQLVEGTLRAGLSAGTLDVRWTRGAGTSFILEVPLSVATMRALLVSVGGHPIGVPTALVERVERAAPGATSFFTSSSASTGAAAKFSPSTRWRDRTGGPLMEPCGQYVFLML